ncbi:efflux RND transporter permease subunit [Halanaerobium kushneri]|uniref:SSD domain-containing protein n=1 Tax=Halanaerobium kushneri TaxID=56779 RepID=A0A1N6SDU2_9FIRM|nr:MMPL family transporter [Halanaerobium kushneri]SIQ39142.1 hypothetical protein SAMN05421834_1049 [Halanaerobium kushneri]
MRDKLFNYLANTIIKKPKTILIITALVTIVLLLFSFNLNLELSWVGLAPKGDPSQTEFRKIVDNYPSASKMYVTVEDKGGDLESAAKIAAENLEKLQYVKRVDYRVNMDYLLDNGLLLYESDNLNNITDILKNPNLTGFITNLNDLYEKEYKGNSSGIEDDKQEMVRTLRGLDYFLQLADRSLTQNIKSEEMDKGVKRLLVGDPYLSSIKGDTLLMTVQPTFGALDYNKLKPGVGAIAEELKKIEKEYPGFKYGLTGMHVIARDEMESTTRDSTLAMIIGLILVLIILIAAFKMWLSPLLAAVPLIVGIIWDMGLTSIFIGRLNIFTVFTAAMLIGLGIDFSVHILSGFTEARSKDYSLEDSVHFTLEKVGPGILTGALTTAAAFFTLTISSLGFLVELGLIMGMGILSIMLAVFLILPALLFLRDGSKSSTVKKGNYPVIGKIAGWSRKWRYPVLAIVLLILIFSAWQGTMVDFYLSIKKIEPEGLESIKVMDDIADKFNMSNDAVLYTTDNLKKTYQLAEEIKDQPQVERVSAITEYLPPSDIQQQRLKNLTAVNQMLKRRPGYQKTDINNLITQLKRLENNLIEIGQLSYMSGIDEVVNVTDKITGLPGNPGILSNFISKLEAEKYQQQKLNDFVSSFYDSFSENSGKMEIKSELTVNDLPADIKSQFISADGSSYLNSVYAKGNLWDRIKKPFGSRFIHMLREKVPRVTGTPIFMRVLYDQVSKEVTEAVFLIAVTLLLLLFFHFRSFKEAFIAFLPLISALTVTMGLIKILNVNLDIFSVLAFPLIIGIGIDDGVHVIHRLNISDQDMQTVFSSVGRAILLTTLTTMASFGSLMIAQYQAIYRLGVTLFIGVAFCFIMTLIIIPALLTNKNKINESEEN